MSVELEEGDTVLETSVVTPPDAAEVEPVEEKAETAGESETPEGEVETTTEEKAEEKKPEQKRGGFQRKIEKLERERDHWRDEALRTHRTVEPEKKTETETPKELKIPKLEDFKDPDDWAAALDDYLDKKQEKKTADIVEAKQKETAQKSAQEKRNEAWAERWDAARAKYADFDEVTTGLNISKAMTEAIMRSDIGPEIGYFLAQNPDENKRINKLDSVEAALEIGSIAGYLREISDEGEEEPEKPTPKKTDPPISKAPPPISTAKKTSTSTRSIYDENISPEEYRRMREAQLKG